MLPTCILLVLTFLAVTAHVMFWSVDKSTKLIKYIVKDSAVLLLSISMQFACWGSSGLLLNFAWFIASVFYLLHLWEHKREVKVILHKR